MPNSNSNLLWGPQTTIKNRNWLYFDTAATSKDWLTSIWTAGKPLPGIWTFCWSDYKNPTSFLRTISRNNFFDKGGAVAWLEKSVSFLSKRGWVFDIKFISCMSSSKGSDWKPDSRKRWDLESKDVVSGVQPYEFGVQYFVFELLHMG